MQIWLKELLLYLIGSWRLLPSLWFCTSGYSYKIAWLARAASSRAFTAYFPQWKNGIHIYLEWHVEKFWFLFRFIVLPPSFSSRCLVWVVCLKTTFNVSGQFVNFLVLLVQLNSQFKYFTAPAHFLLKSFVMIQLQPNFCLMMKKSKN